MNRDETGSYYATLNVSRQATDNEIRHAFRHLAQTFHPDKHADAALRDDAADRFAQINEAYEVLNNPEKRKIYDIYGKQGLVAGLDVGSRVKTVEELREEWEKFKTDQETKSVESGVTHNTHLQCMIDGTALLDPQTPLATRRTEIESIAIQSTVDKQFTPLHAAWLGGNVLRQGNEGGGNLLLGCRGLIDSKTGYSVERTKSMVVFQTTQQLQEDTQGVVTASYSAASGPGLNLSSTRMLTDTVRGSTSLVVGPPAEAGVHLGLSQKTKDVALSTKVQVGALYGVSARVTKAISPTTSVRVVGRVGFNAVDAEIGVAKKLSDTAQVTVSVIYGVQGTCLKTRWSMGEYALDVPVIFSRDPEEWKVALAAVTLTPLGVTLFRHFVIKPLMKSYRSRQALQERKKHAEQIRRQIESALSAQKLQKTVAQRAMNQEALVSGLVVVRADYGVIEHGHALPQESPSDGAFMPPSVFDVTYAVQYLVSNSRLEFFEGVSKAGLMGFCDVAPGQPKTLKIRYLYRNHVFGAEVGDMDGLVLPKDGRLIEDIHEAEDLLAEAKTHKEDVAEHS